MRASGVEDAGSPHGGDGDRSAGQGALDGVGLERQVGPHLGTDGVIVAGRAFARVVLALDDGVVEERPPLQNRDRHAHRQHEQREGRRQPHPNRIASRVIHGHLA